MRRLKGQYGSWRGGSARHTGQSERVDVLPVKSAQSLAAEYPEVPKSKPSSRSSQPPDNQGPSSTLANLPSMPSASVSWLYTHLSSVNAMYFWPKPMVYFPLLTPSNSSRASSEIHLLGKYISMAWIPTLTGRAGISNSDMLKSGYLSSCERLDYRCRYLDVCMYRWMDDGWMNVETAPLKKSTAFLGRHAVKPRRVYHVETSIQPVSSYRTMMRLRR